MRAESARGNRSGRARQSGRRANCRDAGVLRIPAEGVAGTDGKMARAEGDDPVVENQEMNVLNIKALAGLLQLLVIMALLIFVPTGTLDYPQAWIFFAVFFTPVLAITVYLMKNDPKLLELRISAGPGADKDKCQKIMQFLARSN